MEVRWHAVIFGFVLGFHSFGILSKKGLGVYKYLQ